MPIIVIVLLGLFISISESALASNLEIENNFCSNSIVTHIATISLFSLRNPDVMEAKTFHKTLCRKVVAGEISEDTAQKKFRFDYLTYIAPHDKNMKESGALNSIMTMMMIMYTETGESPRSAVQHALVVIANIFLGLMLLVIYPIYLLLGYIFYSESLLIRFFNKAIITLCVIFLLLLATNFLSFLIAGLGVVGLILGILSSVITIILGYYKLQQRQIISSN